MGKVRVLIADDHTVFCDCLKKVLEMQEDLEVVGVAKSGPEAVRRAEETRPDVVLMDIQMPVLDGVRATKLIKELLPSTNILILTMHIEDKYLVDAIEAGASGYLLKELSVSEVVQAVRSVASGNYMLTPAAVKKLLKRANREDERNTSHFQLTRRELEVISLVAAGLTNKEIANKLCVSLSTVKNHLSNIFAKLQCSNRAELVSKAINEELVKPAEICGS